MQSNKKLSLIPVISDIRDILNEGNTLKKKSILRRLDSLYVYARGMQAKSEGKDFYEDSNGNLVEIEKRN